MKRWIIRSFFIGLLLLCVGGWGWTYQRSYHVGYEKIEIDEGGFGWRTMERYVSCNRGRIYLGWSSDISACRWEAYSMSAFAPNEAGTPSPYTLGFHVYTYDKGIGVVIPFWFPTTISAALLWLVWRKTRPKVKGRAFPVELAKQSDKP